MSEHESSLISVSDVLALDAMGVLYSVGDDVADLLVPFVRQAGGVQDAAAIEAAYMRASLGSLSAADFWREVGLDPAVEEQYLGCHQLSAGAASFLRLAAAHFARICCISNDVSEWSIFLRRRFGLDRFITDWFISGDVGIRKPDPGIFDAAAQELGVAPARITFVDDRQKNVAAASRLGFNAVLFGPQPQPTDAWMHFETFDSFSAALSRNG